MMDAIEHRAVMFGGEEIAFHLKRSARRTLAISVNPDGTVEVTAPLTSDVEDIDKVVRERAAWIQAQLLHFDQFRPRTPPRRYVGGESHRYLGRQYRLKIEVAEADEVVLRGGRLVVRTPHGADPEWIKVLVGRWIRSRAAVILRERFVAAGPIIAALGISKPRLIIRPMKKRWGSHTPAGAVILNRRLVAARRDQIDYVIVHELCHVVESNHGQRFFDLLERFMPDWEERKAGLEKMMI